MTQVIGKTNIRCTVCGFCFPVERAKVGDVHLVWAQRDVAPFDVGPATAVLSCPDSAVLPWGRPPQQDFAVVCSRSCLRQLPAEYVAPPGKGFGRQPWPEIEGWHVFRGDQLPEEPQK